MSDWGQVGNQSGDSAEKNEKCGEGNLRIIMKVGVIGAGAISDIYLTNMIEKFDNLESSLNMLSEYMDNIQAYLTDLKGSVSGNDIDYSDQLDDLQDKLTDLSDDVAAILESTTVSENTVSENSLLDTPLNSLSIYQQFCVFMIVIVFLFMVYISILFWL